MEPQVLSHPEGPGSSHPQPRSTEVPPQLPAQSCTQSLLGSSSQLPQLSTAASPKQSPLQSISLSATCPELPPEHTPQLSSSADPLSSVKGYGVNATLSELFFLFGLEFKLKYLVSIFV